MNEAPADDPPASRPRFLLAILLTGLTAGLGGMLLGMLLHAVQHLAYGYSLDRIVGTETFLQGVEAASDVRRLAVLMLCGLVAGGGWWLVYRFGRPLVSVTQAVQAPAARMPARTTLAHALLQIVTVGLGSPLGREVAPREVGALAAGGVSAWLRLPPDQRRLIVACGAGAGLAAVYNVPLGAALFVLEVLLGTFAWPAAAVALATCCIGAVVAWIGLGNEIQYAVPPMTAGASLIVWAVLAGPVFGVAAHAFVQLTSAARRQAARGWRLPLAALVNFTLIGVLAVFLPALLGNGKGPAQLGFSSELTLGMAALLLVLKVAITSGSLRAGASGGLLTPGIAIGALLAVVLGGAWNLIWPDAPPGAYAVVGAAAFLAASMRMPLTATVLLLEFTRVDQGFLVPMILAVAGATATHHFCAAWTARTPAAAGAPLRGST
ncbi:chloride channel protein [Achromobacter sp. 2789STDY5608621]|uniref:chloride channel protein n=1 Tax=Achromobacter sp. 2789STDY5608621 TaxID=1806496 RepID=UPI0006C0C8EB|nr:chloride channel protein [Achromobacter sp. 2789STDY5608621]CUJ65443.1 H(+)/Cl(-) exchange transporter ClcA [Achromobacter sp. 2789STDY5608621]